MNNPNWATQVIDKAKAGSDFKQERLDGPKAAIEKSIGESLSKALEIEVVETANGGMSLELDSDELSDDVVDAVAHIEGFRMFRAD